MCVVCVVKKRSTDVHRLWCHVVALVRKHRKAAAAMAGTDLTHAKMKAAKSAATNFPMKLTNVSMYMYGTQSRINLRYPQSG
jgi:hypothetical protein